MKVQNLLVNQAHLLLHVCGLWFSFATVVYPDPASFLSSMTVQFQHPPPKSELKLVQNSVGCPESSMFNLSATQLHRLHQLHGVYAPFASRQKGAVSRDSHI